MTHLTSKHTPSTKEKLASKDQALARKLLIELLSYQFAFPVRWIETQNEFFSRAKVIERYVEIGPTKILASMAKKTASRHYPPQAESRWSHLKFLSYPDNKEDIYYEYPTEDEPPAPERIAGDDTGSVQVTSSVTVINAAAGPASALPITGISASGITSVTSTAVSVSAGAAPAVPDIQLSAAHIVLALTAQKLKKAFYNVSMEKSIRELSGGKSTLQNELIGDLGAEFSNLPDGAEDLSLGALSDAIQGSFSGKPGKLMSALISKFISSKMPAGFNQAAVQNHLQTHWGIGKQHSVVPLCLAVTMEPPSRSADVAQAKIFLDSIMPHYGSHAGIVLVHGGSDTSIKMAASTVVIDSAGLDAIKKELRDYHMKQYQGLTKYLKLDHLYDNAKLDALEAYEKELEEKLGQWHAEFDENFFNGILSIFDARKGRKYDSWWNWVREDLVRFFHEVALGVLETRISEADERVLRILNRWEPTCLDMVDFLGSDSADPKVKTILPVGRELSRLASLTQGRDPVFRYTLPPNGPKTVISSIGAIEYEEVPRKVGSYSRLLRRGRLSSSGQQIPFVHIRTRTQEAAGEWLYDRTSTAVLLDALETGTNLGLSFAGKAVLVTGAGPKSIGAEVVQGLLCGGARVVVTTSRTVSSTAKFYQQIYRKHGARGSALTVLPFNAGSKKDCELLIEYIYGTSSPTEGDLDYIVPFAAIPDAGELDNLDGKSELAHRAMLVNVLRLLGCVRKEKEQRGIDTRPTTVILPLSPNHGTFGGDGLYSESKLGLETLFNRFYSESWSTYVNICGAVIGWTRGTGLMSGNNIVAEAIEKHDVITFSQTEMAFNVLALMTPAISRLCEDDPVYADLNGGLQLVPNLNEEIVTARRRILDESRLRKALLAEALREQQVLMGSKSRVSSTEVASAKTQRANLELNYPSLSSHRDMTGDLKDLQGMIDLSRTSVVVGFSELSPWGSTRTRWEMENLGHFTLEGYVEIAWIMGLVRHFEGDIKGQPYVGWIDAKSGAPVDDDDFKEKYHKDIISHTGLRFIEPEGLGGYDPAKKELYHEVAVEEDLPPFEGSKATADAFKLRHGDNVSVQAISDSEDYIIQVKQGANFLVPKAIPFDRMVAGQLPKGWDPVRYGIPEDIVQQVDPITQYALCCVSEALLSAGITDPYELYQHIHPSDLANCIGTGTYPLLAMRGIYKDRMLDKPVASDVLQESFMNTMGAWINMLLFSSTGPIKSPVGACATAIESLDLGCEAIRSGKSRVALVGGCDDFQEEMSYEFAKMKATASSAEEFDKGRLPSEMSRPSATSRGGFVESAGCGVQLIMSADLALEMGLPIYGIVGYTQMAGDKIGRSVPAPGKGILTAAREGSDSRESSFLDLEYRKENFNESVANVKRWQRDRLTRLKSHPDWCEKMGQELEAAVACKIRELQRIWSNEIRLQDPTISPITASLATWGLTVDDITVASMHGTSTKANDTNEADVIDKQMTHLRRVKGKPLLAVCQKSLTGHPKGAAGAWQFNGCMQMMQNRTVPGNKNADNIDSHLRQYEHIVYPTETVRMTEVNATILTSFGFGQKGAIAIAIAPKYLFSAVNEDEFEDYRTKVTKRQRAGDLAFVKGIMSNSMFKAKDRAPWDSTDSTMCKVLLDPSSRISSGTDKDLTFIEDKRSRPGSTSTQPSAVKKGAMSVKETGILSGTIQNMLESNLSESRGSMTSVGVDVEAISSINLDNETFIRRNFTDEEQKYCYNATNPQQSFAGRWSAKEAVFKSLHVASRGPGAAMNEIEIVNDQGIPRVQLHGRAKDAAAVEGITYVQISITHSAETVTAVALAART